MSARHDRDNAIEIHASVTFNWAVTGGYIALQSHYSSATVWVQLSA